MIMVAFVDCWLAWLLRAVGYVSCLLIVVVICIALCWLIVFGYCAYCVLLFAVV